MASAGAIGHALWYHPPELRCATLIPEMRYPTLPTLISLNGLFVELQYADLISVIFLVRVDEFYLVALFDGSVEYPEVYFDAAERVENGVEDHGLERRLGIAFRGFHAVHHGLEDLFDSVPFFRAGTDHVFAFTADQIYDLVGYFLGHGVRQVDLVHYRDDLQVVLKSEVKVGYGLRFNTLAGVHNEQGAFAGGDGAGNFVREIDVARAYRSG